MSMYENMKFADHEHRDYPKFIQTGEGFDPTSKSKNATGILVHSAEEEAAYYESQKPKAEPVAKVEAKPTPDPVPAHPAEDPADVELKRLQAEYAKATGKEPDKRWGANKLQTVLSNADASGDQDPDA